MIDEKMGFVSFVEDDIVLERKKAKKKSKKKKKKHSYKTGGAANGYYGGAGVPTGTGGMDGGGGESFNDTANKTLLAEIFAGMGPAATGSTVNTAVAMGKMNNDEESGLSTHPTDRFDGDFSAEEEPEVNLVDQARQLFQQLVHHPDSNRATILNAMISDIGVTESTAISYYTRFMDEFGLTDDDVGQPDPSAGQGADMGDETEGGQTPYGEPEALPDDQELEEPEDDTRAGFIRVVDNAHLIYKRRAENGTYEELWIYNLQNDTNDELEIRRNILAGTDIPPKKTKSEDGVQTYTSTTMGNAQLLHLQGLPN